MIDIRTTGLREARAAGELLAASGTIDVLDALVALTAVPGDQLLTSDPTDLQVLITHRHIMITVVPV
jgi:hypothetical protein